MSSSVSPLGSSYALKPETRNSKLETRNSKLVTCNVSMSLVAIIPKPNAPVELREVPQPELEPNSALLTVELSEVCGTDVYLQRGLLQGVPYPLIPGHVSVGRLSNIR